MTNKHITFEIDGRAIFVAHTNDDDATKRLMGGFRSHLAELVESGRSVLGDGAALSMRPATPPEVAAFVLGSAEACAAGRIEEDDVIDGYPIFLINAVDPSFPEQDVNTGLAARGRLSVGAC